MNRVETEQHGAAGSMFHTEAAAVLGGVQSALTELFAALRVDPTQPQEMSRRFGLDKSLAWKIARVVREEDAFIAVPHFPGKAGFRIFLDSAKKLGAPEGEIERLAGALTKFDQFVETHSGDRETFAMMTGGLGNRANADQHESHRKLAFRGQSATWGVQASLHLSVHFCAPGKTAGSVDTAVVSGLVNFKRLRQEVAWGMSTITDYQGDGIAVGYDKGEAIDASVGPGEAPMIHEFCSEPTPHVRMVALPNGSRKIEIAEGPVGKTGAATCVAGWYYRDRATMYKTELDQYAEHLVSVSTPAECLLHDLYVHKAFESSLPPSLAVYSNLPAGQTYSPAARDQGLLPVGEEVTPLGAYPPSMMAPEFPAYGQLIRSIFSRMGWAPADFRGYRLRLKYPPVPSVAVFRYPLLDR